MCYQLVHGKIPWKSNPSDKPAIIAQILNNVITFDSGWLSVDCIKFINQCLDKNANTRISIKEMLEHPWMKNVIPLMKKNKNHGNVQNMGNVGEIRQDLIRRYPL